MRDILKAGIKVGLATLAGLLGWVVAGKVLAVMLGAAGLGLFGLLRQLLQNLSLLASFNGQTALVQGIACRTAKEDQLRYSGSVLRIQALIVMIVVVGLLVGAPWLGPLLIPHPQGKVLLRWISIALLAVVAQGYAIGLLNGHRMLNELVQSQMLGPLSVLVLTFPMIWLVRGGFSFGFVLMLAGPALVVTLRAVWAARRSGWFPRIREWTINWGDGISFFQMSSALLVAGAITTGSQFFESWLVAKRMGLAQSGQFWTAWTLSMSYVTLVLSSFGTYYMPSLSCIKNPEERRSLIRSYLFLSMLAMPLLVSCVVVFKPWIIRGMFSQALLPSLKVMRWMLIGDFLKGISWVLAFPMLAFNEMKWFFWSEVAFSGGVAGLAWVWVELGGGIGGLGALFMLCYALYLPVMMYYISSKHGFKWKLPEIVRFLGGLAMVLLVSIHTWNDERVRWTSVALLMISTGGFMVFSLRGTAWRKIMPIRLGLSG